jgi:hypothetical protein|tara:strand:- start:373 stop:783 length:411 start_codon:yes stop_codon:yes gene_type:complete
MTLFSEYFFYFIRMANPYEKYLGKEDKLQHRIVQLLDYEFPHVIFTHPNNEGKRTPFERFKIKYLGVKAGVPDILIFNACSGFNGLAIELKVGYNKPTESQARWIKQLNAVGWKAEVCRDYESAKDLIIKYMSDVL